VNLEHVALQVADPVAMADWYVKHLGCSVARSTGEPNFIRFLMDGAGSRLIEIYRNPAAAVPDYKAMHPTLVHVAFQSGNPAVDRDRLVAAGATLVDDVVTTPAGDQLLMLRDPWGLALQLVKRQVPMLAV
jgi:catechol 2,3-dioxygenase-like lactoylglutathione lyase family enzyme